MGVEYKDHSIAYYCEKHGGFWKVKRTFHEFDFKLDIEKLMAELECGCNIWIATVERDSVVLQWYRSLESESNKH